MRATGSDATNLAWPPPSREEDLGGVVKALFDTHVEAILLAENYQPNLV